MVDKLVDTPDLCSDCEHDRPAAKCHIRSVPLSVAQAKMISDKGADVERARIVSWLRSYDDIHRRSALADRIEAGEHMARKE